MLFRKLLETFLHLEPTAGERWVAFWTQAWHPNYIYIYIYTHINTYMRRRGRAAAATIRSRTWSARAVQRGKSWYAHLKRRRNRESPAAKFIKWHGAM